MRVARLYDVLSTFRPAFINEPITYAAELFAELLETDGHGEQETIHLFEILENLGVMLPADAVYESPSIEGSTII